MLRPTERPPPSCAPRLAASMLPEPPPVMIAKPCADSSRETARALVGGIVRFRQSRSEDRYCGADRAQREKAERQLLVDARDPLGIRAHRRDRLELGREQLFVGARRLARLARH